MLANSFSTQAKSIFRAPVLHGILSILLQGFRSCPQVLIFLIVLISSTGWRVAGPSLCRHQFCTQSYASRAMYHHDSNTATAVAVGPRCCNTFRHERLQQHVSLEKLIIFSSVLSPCSSTLLRQQFFTTHFSMAPRYVREQNLSLFTIKSFF